MQIQLKSMAEEQQAIVKGLEKVELELTASESDGPVSEIFCKVYAPVLAQCFSSNLVFIFFLPKGLLLVPTGYEVFEFMSYQILTRCSIAFMACILNLFCIFFSDKAKNILDTIQFLTYSYPNQETYV